jgi:hypothetical protein
MQQRSTVTILVAFVVGLALGLVYGWAIAPVEWTIEDPAQLAGAICQLAGDSSTSPADVATLENMARGYNGQGCGLGTVTDSGAPVVDQTDGGDSGGSSLGLILVILVLVVVFVIVWRRRSAMMGDRVEEPRYAEVPEAGPVLGGNSDITTVPIARFRTTYVLGHDTYDDSFSIENGLGDFLGECGVSVAESIGTDAPKNVTAFEVWLFDKNDIRTITKVVMSDHAFFDDALKAKLAPKGEPVLARENETVVLETATLIINAEITELAYGTGTLPPQSFFERITIELSAWSKEGDFEEPDLQSRADELMNY